MSLRLYMDACCFNRPFDDQSIDRNRLESEAILLILRHVHRGEWELIGSEALLLELNAVGSEEKRERVKGLAALPVPGVTISETEYARMAELYAIGFKSMDALHVACAESAGCDVLLTTDDHLRKAARKHASQLRIRVENPLTWLNEQDDHGDEGNDLERDPE